MSVFFIVGGKVADKGKGKGKKKKEKLPSKSPSEIEKEEEAIRKKQEKARHVREFWDAYLVDVDSRIHEFMTIAIDVSIYFFLSETGDTAPILPFFELVMELHEPNIVYVPSVAIEDPNNFLLLIESLIEDIYSMIVPMVRIHPADKETSYYSIAKNDLSMQQKYDEIFTRIVSAMDHADEFIKEFDEYAILWTDDRQEFLKQFLMFGRILTIEELEQLVNEETPVIKENPPTIAQFKEQIDYYDNLYKKVEEIPPDKLLMDGWLKIDVRPLRQAILNTICKWSNLFKQHLYNRVINSLEELENFIREAIAAMQTSLTEDDYDGLLKVMGYLFKVKERQIETDNMFEPLKAIMEMLKDYGVEFAEEVYVQLQEIPDRWTQCKKVSLNLPRCFE